MLGEIVTSSPDWFWYCSTNMPGNIEHLFNRTWRHVCNQLLSDTWKVKWKDQSRWKYKPQWRSDCYCFLWSTCEMIVKLPSKHMHSCSRLLLLSLTVENKKKVFLTIGRALTTDVHNYPEKSDCSYSIIEQWLDIHRKEIRYLFYLLEIQENCRRPLFHS